MIGHSGVIGLVSAIAILLVVPRLTRRTFAIWALLALLLATMAINRSLSPLMVLAAGLLVYVPQISKRFVPGDSPDRGWPANRWRPGTNRRPAPAGGLLRPG
jgi:hypothetical protein